jgi:phospholipid-binding lipoprotein MlaA
MSAPPTALRAGFAAALLLLLAMAVPAGAAAAAAPAGLVAEFERIAFENRHVSAPEGDASGDDLASLTRRAARRGAESEMAAAVIGAIAETPRLTGEIVEAAIRAAPRLEAAIVDRTLGAFPGFRESILAAAARARTVPPVPPGTAAEPAIAATGQGPEGQGPEEISDPLEGFNRAVFFINEGLDRILLRPLAWLYGTIVPPFGKQRVRNFFANINAPVVFANDILQFEFEDAGATGARFLINSTVGLAGLFDVASEIGLAPHKADFGQTLYSYGSGPGPYLVLPLFGPSNLRDGVGLAVDSLLNPLTWLLEPEENLILAAAKGLVRREALLAPLDALRETSVDYYAALRSLYYQDRAVALGRATAPGNASLDAEFDAFK